MSPGCLSPRARLCASVRRRRQTAALPTHRCHLRPQKVVVCVRFSRWLLQRAGQQRRVCCRGAEGYRSRPHHQAAQRTDAVAPCRDAQPCGCLAPDARSRPGHHRADALRHGLRPSLPHPAALQTAADLHAARRLALVPRLRRSRHQQPLSCYPVYVLTPFRTRAHTHCRQCATALSCSRLLCLRHPAWQTVPSTRSLLLSPLLPLCHHLVWSCHRYDPCMQTECWTW